MIGVLSDAGTTRRTIFIYMLEIGSEIDEPDIRKYLSNQDTTALKDRSNIRTHLTILETEGLIKKNPFKRGYPNKWKINYENSEQLTRYIAKDLIIPGYITYDFKSVLRIFRFPGTQKILSSEDYNYLFYAVLEMLLIPVVTDRSRIRKLTAPQLNLFINKAICFSPSLFSSLFGLGDLIRVQFWATLNTEILSSITKENAIFRFSYHYILSALFFDAEIFHNGQEIIKFLNENEDFLNFADIGDVVGMILTQEALKKVSIELMHDNLEFLENNLNI